MQEVYAALLLHSSGKPVEEGSVKKVLEAAGTHADEARVKALVSSLSGVNIDEAIKQSVLTAAPAQAAEKKEEKAAEKKEEKKAEESVEGLSGLFG